MSKFPHVSISLSMNQHLSPRLFPILLLALVLSAGMVLSAVHAAHMALDMTSAVPSDEQNDGKCGGCGDTEGGDSSGFCGNACTAAGASLPSLIQYVGVPATGGHPDRDAQAFQGRAPPPDHYPPRF